MVISTPKIVINLLMRSYCVNENLGSAVSEILRFTDRQKDMHLLLYKSVIVHFLFFSKCLKKENYYYSVCIRSKGGNCKISQFLQVFLHFSEWRP